MFRDFAFDERINSKPLWELVLYRLSEGLFLFSWLRRISVKNYMSEAESLRNVRVLRVIHFGGEHIIRPRINFEVAVERLIDHQRLAGFRVRSDGEHLIQLVLKV